MIASGWGYTHGYIEKKKGIIQTETTYLFGAARPG